MVNHVPIICGLPLAANNWLFLLHRANWIEAIGLPLWTGQPGGARRRCRGQRHTPPRPMSRATVRSPPARPHLFRTALSLFCKLTRLRCPLITACEQVASALFAGARGAPRGAARYDAGARAKVCLRAERPLSASKPTTRSPPHVCLRRVSSQVSIPF